MFSKYFQMHSFSKKLIFRIKKQSIFLYSTYFHCSIKYRKRLSNKPDASHKFVLIDDLG